MSISGFNGGGANFAVSPAGITRQVTGYPTAPTLASGTQWQNTTGSDVLLVIPCVLAASATAKLIVQFYSIGAAGSIVAAAGTGGATIPITILVPTNSYLRVDLSSGSFGTILAYQV
jgi:hypothetical protein